MKKLFAIICIFFAITKGYSQNESVFVRFKLIEPADARYYVKIGGYIHIPPWYIPQAYIPENAEKQDSLWIQSGQFTPWFNLTKHAGSLLHPRLNRAGGIAEFPNITADFITDSKKDYRKITIELATEPDEKSIVKTFEESYTGSLTSFLVSPELSKDAGYLETASQMTQRRLSWAYKTTSGKRYSPEKFIIQTSFWEPQREELNVKEAEVLWLLGFNTVGNQWKEVKEKYHFKTPGHCWANFEPDVSQKDAETQIKQISDYYKSSSIIIENGSVFNFSDEVTCPFINDNKTALANFHNYLKRKKISPNQLGTKKIEEVLPIETPDQLRKAQEKNQKAANRIFYYTSRFRQESTNERFSWLTEAVHQYIGKDVYTSTLVADHPYFAGTGLGMGMKPNSAWGSTPLACDWFGMARERAVDMAGIEDWLGLQYMYGPKYTWEGFQLMGFQASIFRSGSNGNMPIIAWITPSNQVNLRLKTSSALCQGTKHFFFWTYGPTATSTENYWSDLQSEYDGIATMTRHLSQSEKILADGKLRPTKVALLYSISSDLWQPFGYISMLERRMTYLALVHRQYLVDMLTEEDVIAGKLAEYSVLYVTDPCISEAAIKEIKKWVRNGGYIRGTCAAGTRNQFNETISGLADVFGIKPNPEVQIQQGLWHIRAALNEITYLDTITATSNDSFYKVPLGVIGVKLFVKPSKGKVFATFNDGTPAGIFNKYGKGTAEFIATCPAIAYGKEAKFVWAELKEKWQDESRKWALGNISNKADQPVELSEPVVEAGIYDSQYGTALILANFTYQPIENLQISLNVPSKPVRITSCEKGLLPFTTSSLTKKGYHINLSVELDISDIVLIEF